MKKKVIELVGLIVLMSLPILASSGLHAEEAINTHTGDHSINNTAVVLKGVVDVNVVNTADVSNVIQEDSNTGDNTVIGDDVMSFDRAIVSSQLGGDNITVDNMVAGNTGDGSISTGSVRFAVSIENVVNVQTIAYGKGGGVPEEPETPNPPANGKGGGAPSEEPLLLTSAETTIPTRLPVAGADNILLMLISSAVGTVFVVELLERRGTVPR